MTQFAPIQEQLAILKKGIVDFHVETELIKKLEKSRETNTPLKVKAGFDPTAPDIHLGHTVLMNKLRDFQQLGHEVTFLVGDFTAQIGDPTGKNKTRPPLSREQILANADTYQTQAFTILDKEQTKIRFNSEWFDDFGFPEVIKLCAQYSLSRLLERDDFQKRLSAQQSISVHEILYPLAQGYDSVMLKADIELGGTDQLFNLLVGRDLMRSAGLEPQCIMTVPILEGTDAKMEDGKIVGAKMSKSLGNTVGVMEDPNEQFGKIMSITDELMVRYYDLLSWKPQDEQQRLLSGHPRDAKIALAKELIARFRADTEANAAEQQFHALFNKDKKNDIPDDAPQYTMPMPEGGLWIVNVLSEAQLVPSKSEAKRQLKGNAVSINGQRSSNLDLKLSPGEYKIRVGKKRWAVVTVE